jgi:hypothetical protein
VFFLSLSLPRPTVPSRPPQENITSFTKACKKLGVPDGALFEAAELHDRDKADASAVLRCLEVRLRDAR